MIDTQPFGRTGHESTRIIFGAAALWAMSQEQADGILAVLLEYGINHIDVAVSYGEAELRVGPWMREHRDQFFLATKTGDRTYQEARDSVRRSLERLEVAQVDLIQLHNLVDEDGWDTAMGPGGALEALIEARDEGLVRHIGVTGHGTFAPAMHRRSLERFPFDSVLLPYNFPMLRMPEYARDVEALLDVCAERGVAVQTIKAVARRRWHPDDETFPRFSWYEPLHDAAAVRRAVRFVLARPGVFLNTSSDARILRDTLDAAQSVEPADPAALAADVERLAMEPLFVRGVSDQI